MQQVGLEPEDRNIFNEDSALSLKMSNADRLALSSKRLNATMKMKRQQSQNKLDARGDKLDVEKASNLQILEKEALLKSLGFTSGAGVNVADFEKLKKIEIGLSGTVDQAAGIDEE